MDRIYEANAAASPPSPPATPSSGYPTAGDPAAGVPATKPGDYWYHMITESLVRIIEASGIVPDHTNLDQLKQALDARYLLSGTQVLTAADIGTTVQPYDADIPTVVATPSEMQAGTESALRTMSPKLVADAISALAPTPQTWDWQSAEIPCSGAASQIFSAAHGLGAVPALVSAIAVCKTAVSGFSVGDEYSIQSNMMNVPAHAQSQSGITATSTDVVYAYGNYIPYMISPTGLFQALDTNFSIVLRAKL